MNEIIRTEPSQPAVEHVKEKASDKPRVVLPGDSAADMLRLLAWIFLIGGIVGGLYIISALSEVPYGNYSTRKDPAIVAYGIGVIVTGVLVSAFNYAIAAICDNVRLIAKNSIKDEVE